MDRLSRLFITVAFVMAAALCLSQRVALKTNLLEYAQLTPNVGVELTVGNHSSVELWAAVTPYSRRSSYPGKYMIAFNPEYRRWLIRPQYGHFFGVALGYTYADMGPRALLVDRYVEASALAIGPSYGYSFLINDRWSVECNIAAGYLYARTSSSLPGSTTSGDVAEHHLFAPIRCGVNIVYIIM